MFTWMMLYIILFIQVILLLHGVPKLSKYTNDRISIIAWGKKDNYYD